MRFEMNSKDVGALSVSIRYLMDEVVSTFTKDNTLGKNLLKNIERLYKKLKQYGQEAYDSREDYRNDMASLKEEIEYQKKRLGLS